MTDLKPMELYSGLRDELVDLTRSLSADEIEGVVPLTPGWTIREVVAHVCGLNADVAAGARTDLGTEEATTRQVSTRADDSIDSICDEWLTYADGMQGAIDEDPVFGLRLSADLVVHLHDVQHGLGLPIDRDSEGSVSGGRTYASRIVDRLIDVGGVWVTIELSDGSRFEPSTPNDAGLATLTLATTPYDALRAITGRRSRRELLALDWSSDPGAFLDVLSPYGPPRETDAGI